MSKIININPALFSFSGSSGTRKKRPKGDVKIKVRSSAETANNKTTKRALLKYIRNQQEKNIEKNWRHEKKETSTPSDLDNFNTDFAESLKYLTTVSEQHKPTSNNHTLRNLPSIHNMSNLIQSSPIQSSPIQSSPIQSNPIQCNPIQSSPIHQNEMQIYEHLPEVFDNPILKMIIPPNPRFGCLKGGNLPTYRTWNHTQKNNQSIHTNSQSNHNQYIHTNSQSNHNQYIHTNSQSNLNQSNLNQSNLNQSNLNQSNLNQSNLNQPIQSFIGGKSTLESNLLRENELNQNRKRMSEIKQSIHKNKEPTVVKKHVYYPKQRKTLRRTYTVGKSKVFPKVSVLISNKTIRSDISTKTQLLKQVPINDVKKYLIKHGFIRIGTVSPNDVLRKMYESAILICGKINNHNPDNLLYNFFNDV
jgi:hypothetical protein